MELVSDGAVHVLVGEEASFRDEDRALSGRREREEIVSHRDREGDPGLADCAAHLGEETLGLGSIGGAERRGVLGALERGQAAPRARRLLGATRIDRRGLEPAERPRAEPSRPGR